MIGSNNFVRVMILVFACLVYVVVDQRVDVTAVIVIAVVVAVIGKLLPCLIFLQLIV